jgi:deazaflavin-dependent oxidoreductase (nitroreductase family)
MSELAKWDTFYVIVGSAAGALIGLQFVVLTLIADRPQTGSAEAGAAFGSPTVVHFGVVLFLAALLHAPWQTIHIVAVLWGLLGLGGVAYTVIIVRRMRRQDAYEPIFEDWLCHVALPFAAYAILVLSSLAAPSHAREALFCVGGAALLLLFIGIHNAWDGVSYHVLVNIANAKTAETSARGENMAAQNNGLRERLSQSSEITISVTGRKSGRTISNPVWFVLEEDKLYLLPVGGSDTQWYQNVLKNPSMRVKTGSEEAEFKAAPLTDTKQVSSVVEKFRAKYGAGDVKKYYSKFDVAVALHISASTRAAS